MQRIMEKAAGAPETVDWEAPDTLQTPFSDIGYDSLALLEFASRVQGEYHVPIPDGVVEVMRTPGNALDYINQHLETQ
ncbi:phosphopantetheine-binding protein [Flindersiella endophytica]